VLVHVACIILACGGAVLASGALGDRVVFETIALIALPAVHLLQCIAALCNAWHAIRRGKPVRRIVALVTSAILVVGIGLYVNFLHINGFFGQGATRTERTVVYILDDSGSYYIAVDVLDGDISKNIKATLAGDSAGLNVVGTHQVSFRVTNSMGDTARITLPVDILPANTYTGQVELKANLIRLQVGNSFDPEQYFKHLAVGGGKFTLDDGVQLRITNLVDTETAGVYSATITASYGTAMAFTRIIVIVE
jgi:hypothetical protein